MSLFFFFKQKTAYEMRISDWSSDVCSSDLLSGDDGRAWPLVMVGPVAIDPPRQQHGLGHLLMEKMLAAAAAIGASDRLMLIGDPEYYRRFFGFTADRTGQWRLPGPVVRNRLPERGAARPDRPVLLGPLFFYKPAPARPPPPPPLQL